MDDIAILKVLERTIRYINEKKYSLARRSTEGLIYDLSKGRRDANQENIRRAKNGRRVW